VAGEGIAGVGGVLMVWESHYWKQRLRQLSNEIDTLAGEHEPSTLDLSNLEIAIFTSFFLVRKLIEAKTKISSRVTNSNMKCLLTEKFEGAPPVDLMNRFDTFELYKHHEFYEKYISLTKMCNLFVHSMFLWMDWDEGSDHVKGVRLTSTYEKDKVMYRVSVVEILKALRRVINDELKIQSIERDSQTGEWKVQEA
jgi:hypothetical protein